MPIAFWRDDDHTGYETIDRQRQHLFGIINNLHGAMRAGHGVDMTGDLPPVSPWIWQQCSWLDDVFMA